LGKDPLTGIDHSHRREWVVDRLKLLVANFAIDVGFLATMSNHLHLILRASPRLVQRMGSFEVARRWLRVYPGKRVLDGRWIEPTEEQVEALAQDKERIAVLRKRLANISWFMSALSEYVARRANLEDDTDGRFFSGRFRCREITSDGGLLICGMYVDLNQVRAGEVETPEASQHCSVWYRIQARQSAALTSGQPAPDGWLAPLTLEPDQLDEIPSAGPDRASDKGLLPLTLDQYLRFLDWAGRELRADKRGAIPGDLAPILERLELEADEFLDALGKLAHTFPRLVGPVKDLAERAQEVGRKWLHGVGAAAKLFHET
jgi:hypothetical protein